MRGLVATLCALCALSWSACGSDSSDSDPSDDVTLRGIVRDAQSGDAISDADVSFLSDTLDGASDETNDDGEYVMLVTSDTRKGRVEVKKAGYETRIASVYLDDADVSVDVDLEPK